MSSDFGRRVKTITSEPVHQVLRRIHLRGPCYYLSLQKVMVSGGHSVPLLIELFFKVAEQIWSENKVGKSQIVSCPFY